MALSKNLIDACRDPLDFCSPCREDPVDFRNRSDEFRCIDFPPEELPCSTDEFLPILALRLQQARKEMETELLRGGAYFLM